MSATEPGLVTTSVQDGVATVNFYHPKGNSLPGALLRQLATAFRDVSRHPAARVVVLKSNGTGPFCAGASFDELLAIDDAAKGTEFFSGFAHVINAMRACPKFVIARVHGKAAGGGVGLIAAADYAFALTTASVRLSELAVGFGPFVVGPVIERRIGRGPFHAMTVDAEWRDALWGERHGLFAKIADSVTELDVVVSGLAAKLAASNPDAMTELKRLFWAGTEGWESELLERAAISGRLVLGAHARSSIAKFQSAR